MNRSRMGMLTSKVLLICIVAAQVPVMAQIESDKKPAKAEVSAEDRKTAITFAGENHPELARLLEQLEKSRPGEFARAVRELKQQIQRLEKVREKSPARYAEQLESWKLDSQIRVQIARWSRSHDAELEKQIRDLLKLRREAKLAQLGADQQRLADQLARVGEQLAKMSGPIESQVDEEWLQLSKRATAGKKNSDRTGSSRPTPAAGTVK